MPHPTESKGIRILCKRLHKLGRTVEKSDKKTFDLVVDGKYAEVKTKERPFRELDFLSFTDNQYNEILNGNFTIFLVCNLKEPEDAEIFEFSSTILKDIEPKKYTSHEYNKSVLKHLVDRIKTIEN